MFRNSMPMNEPNVNTHDRIYYDVQILNYESTSTSPPPLKYYEERNTAILNCASDWYVAIVRFEIGTSSALPVFIPSIETYPNTDVNKTVYSVTLVYQNVPYQVYVKWVPQNSYVQQPAPLTIQKRTQENGSMYYNCYEYTYFVQLINKALVLAFQTLKTANPALQAAYSPFISWDSIAEIGILNADAQYFDQALAEPISIYFNNSLYNLFSSFLAEYCSPQAKFGMHKKIIIANNEAGSNSILLPIQDPVYTAIQVTGESTIAIWTPISSICFTSGTLPINQNILGTPLIYIDGTNSGQNSGAQTSPVITDMIASDGNYRPSCLFEPFFPRWISLCGNTELRKIDIQVFYKLKDGSFIPLELPSGCSASVKVCFARKGTI